jgi:hypothetical protein
MTTPQTLLQSKLKQAQQQQLVDSVTGQPLFKPQINRTTAAYPRCTADLPVGEYLYSRRLDRKEHLQALEQREGERMRGERGKARVNKRSEAILLRLKQRRFQQVFQFLDSESTGTLDLLDVVLGGSPRFSNLSAEARKDVEGAALLKCAAEGLCAVPPSPAVLQDMQERIALLVQAHARVSRGGHEDPPAHKPTSAAVDVKQFAGLMHEVVNQTRGVPRSYLLPDVHLRDELDQPTFKPAVNGKSKSIARHRWREHAPVHEQLHQHAKAIEVRP